MAFDSIPARDLPLSDTALDQLFTGARTRNAWTDRPVSEDLLHRLYDLTKFGPTAVNATPARFVFITSAFSFPPSLARALTNSSSVSFPCLCINRSWSSNDPEVNDAA